MTQIMQNPKFAAHVIFYLGLDVAVALVYRVFVCSNRYEWLFRDIKLPEITSV